MEKTNSKTGDGLGGAVFTLEKTGASPQTWTFITSSAATDKGKVGLAGTTPNTISDGLDDGTYTLKETVAPLGCAMMGWLE